MTTALSGRFNAGSSAVSGRFNAGTSAVSGRFNAGPSASGRFNAGGSSVSGRFNAAGPKSGRFNAASSAVSGRFNAFQPASSTHFGGVPIADVSMPSTYQGFFQTGHNGDMWCEFDFTFSSIWRQDGQAFVVGGSVTFDKVATIQLLFSDVGGCQITWTPLFTSTVGSQPGLFQSASTPHAGIAPNPIYTSADWNCGNSGSNVYWDSGTNNANIQLYNGPGDLDTTSVALTDGTVYSVSGTVRVTISAAEYKNNQHLLSVAGEGEPAGGLVYAAFAFPQASVSYELKDISCAWGETPYIGTQYESWFDSGGIYHHNVPTPNYFYQHRNTDVQAASFGVGQQNFVLSDAVNGVVAGVYVIDNSDDGTISSSDYQGNDPQRNFDGSYVYPPHTPTVPTCKATIGVMADYSAEGYGYTYVAQPAPPATQIPNLVATGQRHMQMTISNVMFNSGPWAPLPYSGGLYYSANPIVPSSFAQTEAPSSTDLATVTVTGNSISSNFGFSVVGASSTSAHIYGNIYEGDVLSTTDYDITFGNVANTANYNFTNTIIYNITNLTVKGGHIDTVVPQILSIYPGWNHGSGGYYANYKMVPPVPLDRNDYSKNSITLGKNVVVNPHYGVDTTCWLLDDYSWPIVTVAHAASFTLENWASITGWNGHNATVSSAGGLHLVATGSPAYVDSPSGYNKDMRNYRYLEIALTSDTAGTLAVLINSNRYWTLPIVVGSQTVEIDLCNPSGAAASVTRTGYDTQPDSIYGVGPVNTLRLTIPDASTVTFSSLTLVRKATTAPGSCWPEATALTHATAPEIEWYPPDVPAVGYSCPPDPSFDPDSLILTLTSSNHLYARVWQFRSDGKIAGDLPQAIQSYPFTRPYVATLYRDVEPPDRQTVTQFAALVDAQPGLSCTTPADGSPSAGYPASAQYAAWLTLDNYITAASPTTDCKSTALTLRQLFDGITNFPGQWTHLEYAFLKRRYTVVQGLVVNPSGGSAAGTVVTLKPCSAGTAPIEVATADVNGYFRFSQAVVGLWVVSTNLTNAVIQGRPRALRWVGLPGSPNVQSRTSYDVSDTGRHARAYMQAGTVRVGLAGTVRPVSSDFADVDTTIGEALQTLRWEQCIQQPRLWLTTIDSSSAVKLRYSVDEGGSWTMGISLGATGTQACDVETRHGLKYIYYRHSDGSLWFQSIDTAGNIVQAETATSITSGVDDIGLDGCEYQVGGGAWLIGLTYLSAGSVTYKSSLDGINFS